MAIYVKEALATKAEHIDISNFCEELLFEACLARISLEEQTLHLIGIYRPPGGNVRAGIDTLSHILEHIQSHNKRLVLMGDVNIDGIKTSIDNTLFEEELSTHNIKRLPLPATRITHNTNSSIDCVCTNIHDIYTNTTIIQPGLSDHTAQILQIPHQKNNSIPPQTILRRQIGKKNLESLKSNLQQNDWQCISACPDPNSAYNLFQKLTKQALNMSCPRKETKTRKNKTIQYDPESITLRAEYRRAHNNYEATGRNEDKEIMIQKKKLYDYKLRALRQQRNAQYIIQSDNKTKAVWNVINQERQGKNTTAQLKIKSDDIEIENPQRVAELFNNYFSKIAEKTLRQNGSVKKDNVSDGQQPDEQALPPFKLTLTNTKEVKNVINALKPKTSSGVDEYSSKMVKYCAEELAAPLASIINKSFTSGQFPSELKLSKVYPKHKKGPKSNIENYRPISLVSTFSKIIETIALNRLMSHLTQNNLITHCQHGFLKGKSTNSAIISLLEHIAEEIDKHHFIVGLFLDYSKAFDCLGHKLVSKKLSLLGVNGVENEWFSSYLEDRQQVVEIQNTIRNRTTSHMSNPLPMTRGVPQGSVLGPILFILLTNDFPNLISNQDTTCIMYADDTTLLVGNQSEAGIHERTAAALNLASSYCKRNDLVMNPLKTTQINFSKRKNQIPEIPNLLRQTTTKFLGVTLDKDLSWSEHVSNVCKKISIGVFTVRRITWTSTLEAAKIAYYALVDSQLRYAISTWGGSSAGNLERVLIRQKQAIRALAGLNSRDSCREAFKSLKILTVTALYILSVISHADSLKLPTHQDIHSHNTRHAALFTLPHHRTALFEKNPSYVGRKLKNLLPNNLRNLTGRRLTVKLRQLLLDNPIYTLAEFPTLLRQQDK